LNDKFFTESSSVLRKSRTFDVTHCCYMQVTSGIKLKTSKVKRGESLKVKILLRVIAKKYR